MRARVYDKVVFRAQKPKLAGRDVQQGDTSRVFTTPAYTIERSGEDVLVTCPANGRWFEARASEVEYFSGPAFEAASAPPLAAIGGRR